MRKTSVNILNSENKIISFDVEVPETNQEFCNGLGFRDSIPEKTGMLYINKGDEARMYTPDTRFPVDFIFIDEAGSIIKIHQNAKPNSKKIIKCSNTYFVLEINAGECLKYNIQVGDYYLGTETNSNNLFVLPKEINGRYYRYGNYFYCETNDNKLYQYVYRTHCWRQVDTSNKWKIFEHTSNVKEFKNKYYISKQDAKYEPILKDKEFLLDLKQYGKEYFQYKQHLYLEYDIENDITRYYSFSKGWKKLNHFSQYERIRLYSDRLLKKEIDERIAYAKEWSKEDKKNQDIINEFKINELRRKLYPYCTVFYKKEDSEGWLKAILPGREEYNQLYCNELKYKKEILDFIIFGGSECFIEKKENWNASYRADDTHMTSRWLYNPENNKWYILPDEKLPIPQAEGQEVNSISYNFEFDELDEYDLEEDEPCFSVDIEIETSNQKYEGRFQYDLVENDIDKFIEDVKTGKEYAQLFIEEYWYAKMLIWKLNDKVRFQIQNWEYSEVIIEIDVIIDYKTFIDFIENFQKDLKENKLKTLNDAKRNFNKN